MNFNAFSAPHARQPLFYIGQLPMNLTNVLVALHLATALIVTFASGWFAATWSEQLVFTPSAILSGRIWTLGTYPFAHSIDLWFAVGMFFFWRFGGEVEALLGPRKFGGLYAALTIGPAVGLLALSPALGQLTLAGEGSVHFAIFVAFALVYPNAAMWFNIPVKWFVIAIVGVQTLQYLGYKAWGNLSGLWLSIATAFVYLHREGVRSCRLATDWTRSKLSLGQGRRGPADGPRRKPTRHVPPIAKDKRIDAILDKISASGFQSLSEKEKATLNESSSRYTNRKRP